MTTRIIVSAAALAATFAFSTPRADACTLPTTNVTVKKFWPTAADPAQPNGADANRCDGPTCALRGYLFTPPSGGTNLPAIVYVHGSVDDNVHGAQSSCELVNYFLGEGYVVFMPWTRGVTDTTSWTTPPAGAGFSNTGAYISDFTSTQSCTTADKTVLQSTFGINLSNTDPDDPNNVNKSCSTLHTASYMESEAFDAGFAVKYLASLPGTGGTGKLVGKIALSGHSFGGATVTLGARFSGLARIPEAIIDLSGGVLSWGSGTKVWSKMLSTAVANRVAPMHLIQTYNESPTLTTDSTTVPFLAGGAGPDLTMKLYSDADNTSGCKTGDTAAHCAHVRFLTERDEVARWAPAVVAFLERQGF
jgi:hypothetical protein